MHPSANEYQNHILVRSEDDANRQIARGFAKEFEHKKIIKNIPQIHHLLFTIHNS